MHTLLQRRKLSEPPSVVTALCPEPFTADVAADIPPIQYTASLVYNAQPHLSFSAREHDIVEIDLQVRTHLIAATPGGGGQPCA